MIPMIEQLLGIGAIWSEAMMRASIHGGIAIVAVAVLESLVPSLPPRARCWLWRLAFAKVFLSSITLTPLAIPVLDRIPTLSGTTASVSSMDRQKAPKTNVVGDQAAEKGQGQTRRRVFYLSSNLPNFLFVFWLSGVSFFLLHLLKRYLRTAAFLQRSSFEISGTLVESAQILARNIGLKKCPRIAISSEATSPLLLGAFHPVVIFPHRLIESANLHELEMFLAHELAHIRRRDLLWLWIPTLAQACFFFHPVVWLGVRRWIIAQEVACDEAAILTAKRSVAEYGHALLKIAEHHRRPFINRYATVGVADTAGSLKKRIMAMKAFHRRSRKVMVAYAVAIFFTGALGLIPWRLAEARGRDEDTDLNPGFENDLAGSIWQQQDHRGRIQFQVDRNVAHSGNASAKLSRASESDPRPFLRGCFNANPYRKQRIRYEGFMKTMDVSEGYAGLWMEVYDNKGAIFGHDQMRERPVIGTTDWTRNEIVLAIPESAEKICIGASLFAVGIGTLWVDDVKIERVNDDTPATGVGVLPKPTNLDFEAGTMAQGRPDYWGGIGGENYQLSISHDTVHGGKSSGVITGTGNKTVNRDLKGSMDQCVIARDFAGKRLSYSGYLKTEDVGSTLSAGLWLRVDGQKEKGIATVDMREHPVKGTTNWTKQQVALDIPENAIRICFGYELVGNGTVWADDLTLDAAIQR